MELDPVLSHTVGIKIDFERTFFPSFKKNPERRGLSMKGKLILPRGILWFPVSKKGERNSFSLSKMRIQTPQIFEQPWLSLPGRLGNGRRDHEWEAPGLSIGSQG